MIFSDFPCDLNRALGTAGTLDLAVGEHDDGCFAGKAGHHLAQGRKTGLQEGGALSLVGKEGTALTTLRPSGMALIEDKRFNVVTDGEYIEKDSPIRIVKIEGTRIVVSVVEKNANTS